MPFLIYFCANSATGFISLSVRKHCVLASRLHVNSQRCFDDAAVQPSAQAEANDDCTLKNVRMHTLKALRNLNSEHGLYSLRELASLSIRRTAYDFDNLKNCHTSDNERIVEYLPQFLNASDTDEITRLLEAMAAQGWLMTNPDSVDGLPSFHLNLISNGKPVTSEINSQGDFDVHLRRLLDLIEHPIYNVLLPQAQRLVNSSYLNVGDVFLRRYGQDIVEGQSRNGISAHYDVFSQLTTVCALDNTAAQGTNGLYTTDVCQNVQSSGSTSNHAALRRYFPLKQGDAVLHSWSVLHGVGIQPGVDRTSLVIWFTTNKPAAAKTTVPWLENRSDLDTNDVTQFVLASSMESSSAVGASYPLDGSGTEENEHCLYPCLLYRQSASKGNSFALTRLGSLCEDGSMTPIMLSKVTKLLDKLQSTHMDLTDAIASSASNTEMNLAKRCWLEGAIRGNPLAQNALADELMLEGVENADSRKRLLASILFGLAAQQGDERALEALERVLCWEADHGEFSNPDEFFESAVVKIVQAACCCMDGPWSTFP